MSGMKPHTKSLGFFPPMYAVPAGWQRWLYFLAILIPVLIPLLLFVLAGIIVQNLIFAAKCFGEELVWDWNDLIVDSVHSMRAVLREKSVKLKPREAPSAA